MTEARQISSAKARRSPREIRTAARLLQKEGRRISRKHADRLAPEALEAIKAALGNIDARGADGDLGGLEQEAEHLDELLHRHASFARKSALREMIENLFVAVLIAMSVRLCLYEPFKIPSGSMMPTLRAGDHIFVNKFRYGIQIPFTNTVVGRAWGEIERGDVMVFRYPLDEREDFIKRVVGLPGDTVRVDGRRIQITKAGTDEVIEAERVRLERPCLDEATGERPVRNCELFEETLDGKTYVVRYMQNVDFDPSRRRVWKVPEDGYLVMGDNRNQSHDSLAWTARVEAVRADNLLAIKDLRDLTSAETFTLKRPVGSARSEDPRFDQVQYHADQRAPKRDLELGVWREPSLGSEILFDTYAAALGLRPTDLSATASGPDAEVRDRLGELLADLQGLALGRDGQGAWVVLVRLRGDAFVRLRCGERACEGRAGALDELVSVVEQFLKDRQQHARVLLEGRSSVRYARDWTGRGDATDRFVDRTFERGPRAADRVRIRAWRKPQQDLDVLTDAALRAVGTARDGARPLEGHDGVWLHRTAEGWAIVVSNAARRVVAVVECGQVHCRTEDTAAELARTVDGRLPLAALDWRQFRQLVSADDLPGFDETTEASEEPYEYDRVRLQATDSGTAHTVSIRAWLVDDGGISDAVEAAAEGLNAEPDESVAPGGLAASDGQGHTLIFPIAASNSVIAVRCNIGLCRTREEAVNLARRAAEHGQDRTNFVDPDAERDKPYVPRGNIKGRAERVWWPSGRFWLPVR